MADQDLFERMKTMQRGELESFLLTAKITSRCASVIGVSAILLMMVFPGIIVAAIASATIILVGNIAVGSDTIKAFINDTLEKNFSDK